MKDSGFEQEWRHLAAGYRRARCPKSTAELDREVRRVTWADHPVPLEKQVSKRPLRWLWPAVAAACLLLLLLPKEGDAQENISVHQINMGGHECYFGCNKGCSPESVLMTFNSIFE